MVEIELDGKTVEVPQGSMVMHAANKLGTYVPHFCYHKKLSIAANCRMCLVDVEKAPKPMPASNSVCRAPVFLIGTLACLILSAVPVALAYVR